jgi:hypothetical protein
LAKSDPLAAIKVCKELSEKPSGECLALLAGQLALDDLSLATQVCRDIRDTLWRDECWFMAAEATAASQGPQAAVSTCARSGRFATNCLAHLWLDAATRAHAIHPADPLAAWQTYAPTASWEVPEGKADILKRRHRSTFYDARFNPTGAGLSPPPVDTGWCGSFGPAMEQSCRRAAGQTLQRQLNRAAASGVDLAVLCGDGALAQRVQAATGVRWIPQEDLDRRAAAAVRRSCQ